MSQRRSQITRKTKETEIRIELDLDGTGSYEVATGVPFFDHMLESFTKHGLFDLRLEAKGDLEVDLHHTVEDVGITLGQAFREALGTAEGIRRFGGQQKIFFAHFRNPRGQVPCFDEVFPDEGDIDMVEAVRAFREVGFDGVIRIDHCPGVIGDNARADRSFAYQVGYLKGLVQSLENLGE